MKKKGWEYSSAEDSDIIIVNTCGFIKPAKEESINTTLEFKKEYPDKKIIMAGCLAQRYGESFAESFSELDGIFGNKNPEAASAAFDYFEKGGKVYFPEEENPVLDSEFPEADKRTDYLSFPGSTYVKIAEGCNNNCSYCAIPLIKGPLKSRKKDKVLDEIKTLLNDGFFEINLIAQDLASFGADNGRNELIPLLEDISKLEGISGSGCSICILTVLISGLLISAEKIKESFLILIFRFSMLLKKYSRRWAGQAAVQYILNN